jgi:hypothetical protein
MWIPEDTVLDPTTELGTRDYSEAVDRSQSRARDCAMARYLAESRTFHFLDPDTT